MTTTLAERLREIADNLNNGVRGTDAAGGPKVLVVAPEIAATIREAAAHLDHTAAQGVTDAMVEAACAAAYDTLNKRHGVVFTGLETRPAPDEIKEWMRAALEAALSPAPPAPVGEAPKATNDWQAGLDADMAMADTFLSQQPPSAGEAPAVPVADAREWLIRKNGYFYRPNRSGYTMEKVAAGRYTKAEAEREASIEPENFTVLHESEVPDAPQVVDLKADLEAMRRDRDMALAACKAAHDSIKRFPGSVHDRAMAKLAKALGNDPDRLFIDHEVADLEAENAALKAALEPFVAFATDNLDADDGNSWGVNRCERDRIVDWFGPSEFNRARALLHTKDEG